MAAADQPGVVVATARELTARSGAERVTVILDQGADQPPALIDVTPGRAAQLAVGDQFYEWDESVEPRAEALPLPEVRPHPPMTVDAARGEISTVPGGLAQLAGAVRDMAAALPGRSVVTGQWATDDPAAPLTVAARRGEPLIVALGEEQFPMPDGWPG